MPQRFEVAASDLARFEFCEQKAYFDERHGQAYTSEGAARAQAGVAAHQRFEHEPATDKRCFVATCVYGVDAPETQVLRRFRDRVLMPSPAGRLLVRVYYALSPGLVSVIAPFPSLLRVMRSVLDRVIARVRRSPAVGDR